MDFGFSQAFEMAFTMERVMTTERKTLYCSFCGHSQHEVKRLYAGASAKICTGCVELCVDIEREYDAAMPISAGLVGVSTADFVVELNDPMFDFEGALLGVPRELA